jgi:hypothetical protein
MANRKDYGKLRTKDIGEICVLFTTRHEIINVEYDGAVCYFVFKKRAATAKMLNDYMLGALTVNARDFNEAHRRVKQMIHERTDRYWAERGLPVPTTRGSDATKRYGVPERSHQNLPSTGR